MQFVGAKFCWIECSQGSIDSSGGMDIKDIRCASGIVFEKLIGLLVHVILGVQHFSTRRRHQSDDVELDIRRCTWKFRAVSCSVNSASDLVFAVGLSCLLSSTERLQVLALFAGPVLGVKNCRFSDP